jgi:hypothetical protein
MGRAITGPRNGLPERVTREDSDSWTGLVGTIPQRPWYVVWGEGMMVRRWLELGTPFLRTRTLASGLEGHPGRVLDARQMLQEPEWLNRLKFAQRFIQDIGVPNERVAMRAWGLIGPLLLIIREGYDPLRLW